MKKKMLLLVGLVLCLLLVGCGKGSSEEAKKPIDVIPDPNEYFSNANISMLDNSDDGAYYMIEKYDKADFDKYINACTSDIFTDIDYSTTSDDGKIYYIYDSNHKYRLECTMDNKREIINIILYVVEDKQ